MILLAINLQAWDLAAGEASATERGLAFTLLAMALLSLLGVSGWAAWLWIRGKTVGRLEGLIPLALSLVYLGSVVFMVNRIIPAAVSDWMLPRDQWLLKQFALMMPAALYGAMRVLCPERDSAGVRVKALWQAILVSVLLLAASLAFPFFVGFLGSIILKFSWVDSKFIFIPVFGSFMALAILAAASLLRVCVSIYLWSRTRKKVLMTFTIIIAIVGPLGGLALNAYIPFPVDFQIIPLYVLALLNGIVLALPSFTQPWARRLVWLARCALFPFTVYFFAVFLPLLPLGPLAMLCFALGFLMYVPVMLFLLHGFYLIDGFRAEARTSSRWVAAALGITAILLWPVAYTAQARWDRATLFGALDYLQYPDYAKNERFAGSPRALRSALIHLRDFKQGIYLPYLSEYYNWLAFDNLVLPQDKMNVLAMSFLGEPLPASPAKNRIDLFGWGDSRGRGWRNASEALAGAQGTRPPAEAVLDTVNTAANTDKGMVRAVAKMTLRNPTAQTQEFRTTISVPAGVLISGLWLTIGDERVPGKIYEKRAALWVYQKITEVRPVPCDPAMLRYIAPGQVELSVYPVEANAPRFVEVEFLYPEGMRPGIEIAGKGILELPGTIDVRPSVGIADDGNFSVAIPALADQPTVLREPYFHFVVDASKGSIFSKPAELQKAIQRVAKQFPAVSKVRVSFANFEREDFRNGELVSVDELLKMPAKDLQPTGLDFRGGFLGARAIKEVLWRHHLALEENGSHAFRAFPQIVVLKGSDVRLGDQGLNEFARLLPDLPGYWVQPSFEESLPAAFFSLDGEVAEKPRAVCIYQAGSERFAAVSGSEASYTSISPPEKKPEALEVFDSVTGNFVPMGVKLGQSEEYGKAIRPWVLELGRLFEPFKSVKGELGELLKLCRETGILVPSAAYMVVENTAQWKMLERTEKKALKGHDALELSEPAVPEPGTLLLLISGLVILYLIHPRSRRSRRISG